MERPKSNIYAWGSYTFGFLSVDKFGEWVEVYVRVSCGQLCGHGVLYTLQRNGNGEWKIIESDLMLHS
jgi:hypothetical protein